MSHRIIEEGGKTLLRLVGEALVTSTAASAGTHFGAALGGWVAHKLGLLEEDEDVPTEPVVDPAPEPEVNP
jgi:hypothetical protein